MRGRLPWVLVASLLVVLAGCAGSEEPVQPASNETDAIVENGTNETNQTAVTPNDTEANAPTTETNASAPEDEEDAGPQVFQLSFEGPQVDRQLPIEGTFGPNETCVPVGCPRSSVEDGDPIHHDVPLDPHIPADLPVRITGELRYDQENTGDVHPNLRTGQAQIYGARITNTQGPTDIDFRLSSPAENPVVLEIGGHAPDGPEGTSYGGNLSITADPNVVPAGVPTSVPVPDDARELRIAPKSGEALRFTVWDEDGERITRRSVEDVPASLDVSNRSGARVAVQIEAPASGAHVSVLADEPPSKPLQALDTIAVQGDAVEAVPGRPVSGSFETSVPPVAVGIYEENARPAISRTGEDPTLEITSPSRTVMDRSAGQRTTFDTPLRVGAFEDRFVTRPDTSELEPGTYEFQVTEHRDAGAAFGGFALVYANATSAG